MKILMLCVLISGCIRSHVDKDHFEECKNLCAPISVDRYDGSTNLCQCHYDCVSNTSGTLQFGSGSTSILPVNFK